MFYFSEICEVNLSCYFFFTSETEVGCVEKLRHLYLFPGFLYSPRSHMINVLKIPCGRAVGQRQTLRTRLHVVNRNTINKSAAVPYKTICAPMPMVEDNLSRTIIFSPDASSLTC